MSSPIAPNLRRLSVSTWSLHHWLGAPPFFGPEASPSGWSGEKLLELPSQLAALGISTLEICHFHLPTRDETFLAELRAELVAHRIELWSLLIDDGDLNHPQHAARDQKWIESYLPVAVQLGAQTVRVIAGKGQPTPENLAQSIGALQALANQAETLGLHLLTENWFDTTGTPTSTLQVLDALKGRLGLLLDFGNWKGDAKYENLARIAPCAESCHTKAAFQNGQIEREDYLRCLEITRQADFQGPYTLIYDSGGDEWNGLSLEREVVEPFLH